MRRPATQFDYYGPAGVPGGFAEPGIALGEYTVLAQGATAAVAAPAGIGGFVVVPRNFWESAGWGTLILLGAVCYFDIKLLNK